MKWLGGSIAIAVMLLSGCDCGGGRGDSDARWLDLEIERPEIEEAEVQGNRYGEIGGNTLLTKSYLLPPGHFNDGGPSIDGSLVSHVPTRKILENHGIDFGPGAQARYDRRIGTLRVTQTRDQMERLDALIFPSYYAGREPEISFLFEIFELSDGDALKLERSAAPRFEHASEHEAVLQMVRDQSARIVTSATIICRSGQRTNYEDAEEIRYVGGFEKPGENDSGPILPVFEVMKVGTVVGLDVSAGPDNRIVDVNLQVDHHLAPPVWQTAREARSMAFDSRTPQFRIGSINWYETILSGQVKLLCSWKLPPRRGVNPHLRHLVFIAVTSVR